MAEAPDDREWRRRINDDRRRTFGSSGRPLALRCECSDPDCLRTVVLTVEEYDARRSGAIVHDDHVAADAPLTAESGREPTELGDAVAQPDPSGA
jgi:hypothetical protein